MSWGLETRGHPLECRKSRDMNEYLSGFFFISRMWVDSRPFWFLRIRALVD